MSYNKRTLYTLDDFELPFQPSAIMDYKDFLVKQVGDKTVIGYLADDSDCVNPLEDCDGMGHIYTAHRHSRTHSEMQEALGLDGNWEPDLEAIDEDDVVKLAHQRITDSWNCAPGTTATLFLRALDHCEEHWERDDEEQSDLDFVLECLSDENELTPVMDLDEIRKELWEKGRNEGTIGNKYAISLDVYEHGQVMYSVSGSGPQCRWDTAHGGAVWVPDDVCEDEIRTRAAKACGIPIEVLETASVGVKSEHCKPWKLKVADREFSEWNKATAYAVSLADPKKLAEEEYKAARELAKSACETYTDWCNGNCFGVVVVTFETEGKEQIEEDAVWGFIGDDYAYESLKSDYFEPAVKHLEKENNNDQ